LADDQAAYLRELEEEGDRPRRVRQFLPRRVIVKKGGGGLNVTVALADGQSSPVNAGPINFTVTFNKPATGFTNADISFTGSTVGGTLAAAVTGTNPYNVAVTGMTGSGLVQMNIPAAAATDATGAPFPASNSASVTFDATPLTVTINKASGQDDPTTSDLIGFRAVFSKAVVGFTSADVSFTGSTVTGTLSASVSGSGSSYMIFVSGATAAGNVVASIPAGAATDLAGNLSQASTSTDNVVAFDPGTVSAFPDATNTGYTNAPGYPGFLTPAVQSDIVANTTYYYRDFDAGSGSIGIDVNNCVFIGCRFQSNNITDGSAVQIGNYFTTPHPSGTQFIYCTISPRVAVVTAPPGGMQWPCSGVGASADNSSSYQISGTQGYQFAMRMYGTGVTMLNCDIWGFANGPDFPGAGGVMPGPSLIKDCWIHDARDPAAFEDHTDGLGYTDGSSEPPQNVTIDHCTIASFANTNAIAFQYIHGGKYDNVVVKNCLFTGFNQCTDMGGDGTAPSEIQPSMQNCSFLDNTYTSHIQMLLNFTRYNIPNFSEASNVWRGNRFQFIPGTSRYASFVPAWTSADDGKYVWPDGSLNATDYVGGGGGGGTVANIAFESAQTQGGVGATSGSLIFTAASAAGKERLVALCGIAKSDITTTTFTSVTIDGQAATQVGSTIRQADSGGNGAVVAMFRATGTSSTTVTVAFNVTSTGSVGLFDHRGALWTLTNAGTVFATTSDVAAGTGNLGDLDLSINTTTNGVTAAFAMLYSTSTRGVTWSGLTESYDGTTANLYSGDWFSAADLNVGSGSTPLTVTATLPTNFDSNSAVAAIAVSFNHT